MIYLLKHLDASRHVMMKEMSESQGDTECILRLSCERAARRYEQLKQRLSEKIPGVSPTRFLFEIKGREGTIYSMAGDEKIITEVQICTPVGLPFHRMPERALTM